MNGYREPRDENARKIAKNWLNSGREIREFFKIGDWVYDLKLSGLKVQIEDHEDLEYYRSVNTATKHPGGFKVKELT